MKSIYIFLLCLLSLPAKPSDASEMKKDYEFVSCKVKSFYPYWEGPRKVGKDDFIVVYSIAGLVADLRVRLGETIFNNMYDASKDALDSHRLDQAGKDVVTINEEFYARLREKLSNDDKDGSACQIELQQLKEMFVNKYYFSFMGSDNNETISTNNANELNVRQWEFVSLLATTDRNSGSCKQVSHINGKSVSVCI